MGENEEKKEKNTQTAEEIAQIMVENMKANMNDPNFFEKQEGYRKQVLDKVLKKRKERNKEKNDEE